MVTLRGQTLTLVEKPPAPLFLAAYKGQNGVWETEEFVTQGSGDRKCTKVLSFFQSSIRKFLGDPR